MGEENLEISTWSILPIKDENTLFFRLSDGVNRAIIWCNSKKEVNY